MAAREAQGREVQGRHVEGREVQGRKVQGREVQGRWKRGARGVQAKCKEREKRGAREVHERRGDGALRGCISTRPAGGYPAYISPSNELQRQIRNYAPPPKKIPKCKKN